jgi:hypothetical protein
MTLEELYTVLKSTGYPVAYSHFENPVNPPFIAYLVTGSANFYADNTTYLKINEVQIELYTSKKDLTIESNVESVLDAHSIPYETTETYIDSERLFQKIYEVSL